MLGDRQLLNAAHVQRVGICAFAARLLQSAISNRQLAIACLLAACLTTSSPAQDLLPGEMPVKFGRKMVEPDRFPTVRELMDRLDKPEQAPAIVFRFYEDRHNHYAPQWSPDGRALSVLRSDIEAHTSKIVILPSLDAETPVVLYPESVSYDHMFAWSVSGGRAFAFASTNEPAEQENLHVASLKNKPQPKRVTSGPGVKASPSLWVEGPQGQLFFSHAGKLAKLDVDIERPGDGKPGPPLGDGVEASLSPDGQWLVWTERIQLAGNQNNYSLKVRDLERSSDQRLASLPGMLLRNPTWSPDGRQIAFYARPMLQTSWRLYVVPAPSRLAIQQAAGSTGPAIVAQDVRVEEHFQNFGPSWDPRGNRLWFFGRAAEQEYYPLRWATLDGRRTGEVGYPRRLTTGLDVAVNPNPALRAVAFCAIEDLHQDVIVMILSHEPE
jgi:Tol biopolymer transport system component